MNKKAIHRFDPRRQRGAVLIVALVILLVLTVLGTASMRDTSLEERMAGSYRDYSVALEAAEAALRVGEGLVATSSLAFDGTDGSYEVTSLSIDPHDVSQYEVMEEDELTLDGEEHALFDPLPEYFVEQLPEIDMPRSNLTIGTQNQPPRIRYHRVTAKGYGVSPNTEVILQSTYFDWNGSR